MPQMDSRFRAGFAVQPGLDVHAWLADFIYMTGLKQSFLARELEIDLSVVNIWATGKRPVPAYRVPALAAALTKLTGFPITEADLARWSADGLVPADWREAAATGTQPIAPPLSGLMFLQPPPLPEPVVVEAPAPVGPSEYPLLWCTKTHGAGGKPRRHHHGPRSAWADGPVVTDIDDFARGPASQPLQTSEVGRHHLGQIALRIACTCKATA